MMFQRQRIYEIVLGDTKTRDAVIINDLQVAFDISKNSDNKKTSNAATVEIYNLSDETLRKLDTDYLECSISCGYLETGLINLFKGQVVQTTTVRKGTDKITQLQMGEGYVELTQQFLKGMVPAGGTAGDVIEKIRAEGMPGVAKGAFTGININNQVLYGYPLTGTPKQMLDEICKANRIEYCLDRGVLTVRDETGISDKNLQTAFVLNENSGLIDIPYQTSADGSQLKKDKTKRPGVQFRALLNGRIIPGSAVKLESKLITGWYKVVSARYYGDYRGNDWYVDCFCTNLLTGDVPSG